MATQTKTRKMPVTRRALIQRLNRKLVKNGEWLKIPRGQGRVYLIDTDVNGVLDDDVDIEALARKEGVLFAFEELAKDGAS